MPWSHVKRAAFAAAGTAALLLLASLNRTGVGTVMPLVMVVTLLVSMTQPAAGALIVFGLGPVTPMLSVVADVNQTGVHFTEALLLAFIAGASLRRVTSAVTVSVAPLVLWPSVLLIAAALASAAVQEPVLAAQQQPPVTAIAYGRALFRDYLVAHNNVTLAVQFSEGLLVLILVADSVGRAPHWRDRAVRMLVAGGTGAAALNVVRLLIAAARRPQVFEALRAYAVDARISAQYSDWNAAGSYFAMVLVVAVGLARIRPAVYAAPAMVIAAALWLTGSRTAMAVVLLIAVAAACLRLRRPTISRAAALAGLLILVGVLAGLGWRYYPSARNDPASFSWNTRLVLWKAGVRMMAHDPLFGVGVGRFYDLSPDYAESVLAVIWRPHENAHNNFVQMLAELGVPGLLFFVAVIGGTLVTSARVARLRGWSLPAGLTAYLLTCLTGHPLLVPEAAYPFWAVMGLAAADTEPVRRTTRAWRGWVAGCAVAAYALSIPPRTTAALRNANLENTTVGLSAWQQEPAGRFRWATVRSSFYYPSSGRAVRIPLRRGPDSPPEVVVRVIVDGQEADRLRLRGDGDWRIVRIVRRPEGTDPAFLRVDLTVVDPTTLDPLTSSASRMLMVGQPSIVWQP
jgi:O-antigen ligase